MKRVAFLALIILIAIAYVGGYWPQHQRMVQAQKEIAGLKAQLSKAQSVVDLCQLQGRLIVLIQETGKKNFSDAAGLSTKFFDGVRHTADNTPPSPLKTALESALNQRDAVTAAIAKGDPQAHDLLVQVLANLSQSIAQKDSEAQPKS